MATIDPFSHKDLLRRVLRHGVGSGDEAQEAQGFLEALAVEGLLLVVELCTRDERTSAKEASE